MCYQDEFNTSCWVNENDLAQARNMMVEREEEISAKLVKMQEIQNELARLGMGIKRHSTEWKAIECSAAIRTYALEHLLASRSVRRNGNWNTGLVEKLEDACLPLLECIECDWNRNRFADDPNKNGIFQPKQHLLYRFRQMHAFHREILEKSHRNGNEMNEGREGGRG